MIGGQLAAVLEALRALDDAADEGNTAAQRSMQRFTEQLACCGWTMTEKLEFLQGAAAGARLLDVELVVGEEPEGARRG